MNADSGQDRAVAARPGSHIGTGTRAATPSLVVETRRHEAEFDDARTSLDRLHAIAADVITAHQRHPDALTRCACGEPWPCHQLALAYAELGW